MADPDHELETTASEDSPRGTVPRFRLDRGEWAVLLLVLLFYAATRLYAIEDYPIYFFCDEALQANLAEDLVSNGFRDADGNLAPAYFLNVRVYNLGLSVWIHALPVALFGKTIFVVRATSVMTGLLGVAALMLALKWFFRTRLWWAGGLVIGVLPAWFLHSRTAFETAMMVGFYATFVLAYLLYRLVSPWWLSAAIVCGGATFYSYSNGQGVMFVTCLLLLVADWRYHWKVLTRHRRAAATSAVVLLLVAAPYVRFRYVLHPEMMETHFADLSSYWIKNIPVSEKLARFAHTYLRGLSPGYWFTEDTEELVRHRMLGRPYLPLWLAPAVLVGLGVSLWRARGSPAHRLVLIAMLAAPFSASLVDLRITRVLAMMVPATLAATVGLDRIASWLARAVPGRIVGAVIGVGLAAATFAMTRDAVVNGPRWFTDYGLYGMQWGAKEVFSEIKSRMATARPEERWVISHFWANNTNAFGDFFLSPKQRERIQWGVVDDLLRQRRAEVGRAFTHIVTPEEFERAKASPKLRIFPNPEVILDPSGRPAFYILHLAYTPEADAIFEQEARERRRLVEDVVTVNGRPAHIRHPPLDIGHISDAFDGDITTLARTLDANPARIVLTFETPVTASGLRLHLWTETYRIRLRLVRADGEEVQFTHSATTGQPPEPVEIRFPSPVSDVRVFDLSITKRGDAHVHLREIEIIP